MEFNIDELYEQMKNQKIKKPNPELVEKVSYLQRKVKRLQSRLNKLESSDKYEKIASTLLDGLFIYTKSGFQSVNESLAQLLGYESAEFLKLKIEDVVAPDYRVLVGKRAKDRLAGIKVPDEYDVELLHKDGKKTIPVTLSVRLLKTKKDSAVIGTVRDNSERTKVKSELKEFEAKFNAITNSAADGIIIITNQLEITYWNNAAERMFNYSNEEALGKDLLDLLAAPVNQHYLKSKLLENNLTTEAGKSNQIFESSLTGKDSRIFPVEISTSKIESEDQNHMILIIRDISERQEKNRQLSEERMLTQHFMDYIPFSIYFKDLESKFIKVNKATVKKLGFKEAEELLGKTDHDVFTKEHAEQARIDELKLISGEQNVIHKMEKETWKVGKLSWVSTTKVPLRDYSGKIIGTFGITRDITQIKKSELIQKMLLKIISAVNTVEAMEHLYLEIHQAVKELMKADNFYIALFDEDSKLLSFPYFVDEYDPSPEPRIAGRGLTEYIIRSGKAQLIDAELDLALRKLGETNLLGESSKIWLGVPLMIGEKTIGAVVVQDYAYADTYGEEELQILTYVSEQIANAISKKNSERQLKIYSEELQELNASKDKFFSIIAHDLKSPFQGLIGLSRVIVEEYAELTDEELKSFVLALNESAESTYGLIENLLEWSRLQTGKMKFNPTVLTVTDIIENIKMLLFQTAELKNIKIKNEIDQKTEIWGDKYMISSLFQNLISNAIKFTNRFGEIRIKSTAVKEFIEIQVIDNGVGIELDEIEKLFSIDSTYTTRGTEQEKGTGLGLILCKEIVNRHGGDIRLESEKEKGTKVIFTLKITEGST